MAQKKGEDFYTLLGLGRDASAEEIKKNYKRLAMKYHPDRNPGDKKAEEDFKRVKRAYEVLSDSQKRAAYDRYGHAGVEGMDAAGAGAYGGTSGFQDASSIFGDIFGDIFGGGHQSSQRNQGGADLGYELSISLEEAMQGVTKNITVPTWVACQPCEGSGAKAGCKAEHCKACGGRGTVQMHHGFISVQQTCGECRGKGKVIKHPCASCHGQGRVRDKHLVAVEVPAGVASGDCLRFTGKGEAGLQGTAAGDLIVQIEVKPHPIFVRKHNDLHVELPISFGLAALGGDIQVPTMGGSVKLSIPVETQSGRTFRLRGKGIKSLRGGAAGDLLCKVTVETPIKLNEEQKACLQKFNALLDSDGKDHSPRSRSWFDAVKRFFS